MSSAVAKMHITEKAVTEKSRAIKNMIIRHQIATASLMTLFCVHQLTYLLPALKDCSDYFFGDEKQSFSIPQKEEHKKESLGFFAGIIEGTKDLFGTTEGWTRIGSAGLNFAGMVGSIIVSQQIADVIAHPNTLRWYIYACVPYLETTVLIEKLTKKLTEEAHNEKRLAFYRSSLNLSCQQLVSYGEDICAYITYKAQNLPPAQKMHAEKTYRYLLNYHNEVFNEIFAQLSVSQPEYARIGALMQAYRLELKYQRKLFSCIEGETKVQRRTA